MKDLSVAELVLSASAGSQGAWDELVTRYMPLVWSVIRKYRLFGQDAEDVSQTVWLRLVEHLDDIREPQALPKWIATITRNETMRLFNARQRVTPVDPTEGLDREDISEKEVDTALLESERRQAMRDGLRELTSDQRELLLLLAVDPPIAYTEISERLQMPIGSIGPTRRRCLDKLRNTAAMKSFFSPVVAG